MNDLISNLMVCTNSNNYKKRAAAYIALGNFDRQDVLAELVKGLDDEHYEARDAARTSIRKIYDSRRELEFFEDWLREIEELNIS